MITIAPNSMDETIRELPTRQARVDRPVPSCLLCAATGGVHRLSAKYPDWLCRCASCGLIFTHPQPEDAELAAIYDADYFQAFGYGSNPDEYRRMKQAGFRRLLAAAERFVAPGRLLDVGCGLGDLLFVAQSRGWDVTGLEPNPFAIARANELVPAATVRGSWDDLPGQDEAFDLITCSDVLEHVRHPDQVLDQMRQRLRPGGCVLLTTVDVGSWPARMLGPLWPHFHRDHLWYFNRPTLIRLVELAGFQVLHWTRPRKVFSLSYVLSILNSYGRQAVTTCAARGLLHRLPSALLHVLWPMAEGQLLVARLRE